jgi:hypothetical protein
MPSDIPMITRAIWREPSMEDDPADKPALTQFNFQKAEQARAVRPAAQKCPGEAWTLSLQNERAQGKPGAGCTRSLACKNRKHASSSPQVHRIDPAFPAQWF